MPITTIVHFEMPAGSADRFLAYWQDHIKDAVGRQPGLIDGIFHRSIDPDGPFQFINVARWDSPEQLAAGLAATGDELPDMASLFTELGVTITQNNYAEAARSVASPDAPREEPAQYRRAHAAGAAIFGDSPLGLTHCAGVRVSGLGSASFRAAVQESRRRRPRPRSARRPASAPRSRFAVAPVRPRPVPR